MKTILIIDDEKDLCALLKNALNKEQYSVDCAYSLADACSKLKENYPDIILLDNNLPDGSGLEYYNLYPREFKKSLVVFITADPSADIDERVDLSGVAAFIRKPFSLSVLKDTFKRLA
jgi:DNA-binding response OmpR family regulator